jgi:hypothetical protein
MWMKLDTTGDRKLNLKELEVFLPYDGQHDIFILVITL